MARDDLISLNAVFLLDQGKQPVGISFKTSVHGLIHEYKR